MKEILLRNGGVTFVDDEDFEFLNQFKWYRGSYAFRFSSRKTGRKKIYLHRIIMGNPKDEVDHIDKGALIYHGEYANLNFKI